MKKQSTLMKMPVLYQNKRTAILDCSKNQDEGIEGYGIVMWYKFLKLPMGWGNQMPNGSFSGFVTYGPHELGVNGATVQEFAVHTLSKHKWTIQN